MNNQPCTEGQYQLAYSLWRWNMWIDGLGSYVSIEWAVEHHLLIPFHEPGLLRRKIARWVIRKFGPMEDL
jgi:hypothetical protein